MKKILFTGIILAMISTVAPAESVKLVFGPLDGDDAGLIIAEGDETFELELWARTVPGINIVAVHLPLSSNNLYIRSDSRAGGEVYYPLSDWGVYFIDPDDDPDNENFTNQSILTMTNALNGINTDGEWWRIATLKITTVAEVDHETHYDAFISGSQQCNGNIVLVDYDTGEIDLNDIEQSFAPLLLTEAIGIDDEIDLPDDFALSQNYPNPFNARTTIRYDLPEQSDVRIDIFNILGARIATLVEESKSAGSHTVTWDAKDLSSGVYLYKIQAGEFTESKLSVLLK